MREYERSLRSFFAHFRQMTHLGEHKEVFNRQNAAMTALFLVASALQVSCTCRSVCCSVCCNVRCSLCRSVRFSVCESVL